MNARNSRTTPILAAAVMGLGLAGCRSFPADAPSRPARIESFSAVSDRPDSVLARKAPAQPGRISSRVEPPAAADSGKAQAVTGRVVDSSGTPVANARVRLAFDGATGSREVQGVSDRDGAFRLRGLKPDGRYTLIAEWEDSREVLVGRRRVDGTEEEVEIEVRSPDDEGLGLDESGEYRELSARQARSNQLYRDILPGQSVSEPTLASEVPAGPARLASRRREAAGPIAEEDPVLAAPTAADPVPSRPTWKAGPAAERLPSARPPIAAEPDAEPAARFEPGADEVEENPLPPAREVAPGPAPDLRGAPEAPLAEPVVASPPESTSPAPRPEPVVAPPAFQPYPSTSGDAAPIGVEEAPAPVEEAPVEPISPAPAEASQALPEPSEPALPETPVQELPPPSIEPVESEAPAQADAASELVLPEFESAPQVVEPAEAEPVVEEPQGPPAGAMVLADPPVAPPAEPSEPIAPDAPINADPPSSPLEPAPAPAPAEPAPPVVASPAPAAEPKDPGSPPPVESQGGEPGAIESEPAESPVGVPEGNEPAQGEQPAEEPRAVEPAPAITWNDLPPPGSLRRAPVSEPGREASAPVALAASRSGGPEGLKKIGAKLLSPWGGEGFQASCRFDPRSQRLADFVLPDLQGRPFRRSDLQSRNVLLVFWGSWSESCVQAISRLNELQEHHDPAQFQVVAVAYEQAEPEERARVVGSLTRRLGIDFPVLLGETDGSCPLQEALNVQYYPTYLLLDQYGRIQWRGTGGGSDVLGRLERAVSTAVHRTSQPAAGSAPVARQEDPPADQPATRVR